MKETLKNGTHVYIDDVHRFGTDAMLLSHFCNLRRAERALDLCSGCGIIPLRFIDMGAQGDITAIELQKEAADLILRAKIEQDIQNLEVLCRDLSGFRAERLYDVVSCNPPYFTSGDTSKTSSRALARHEQSGLLNEVIKAASSALKDGGRLCICHKPERMVDIFCLMREHKIEPKRLRYVRAKAGRAPYLILVDGRKNGGVGLHHMPTLTIENKKGEHTREVVKIYGGKY